MPLKNKIIDAVTIRFVIVGIINTIVGEGTKFLLYYLFDRANILSDDINYIVSPAIGYAVGSIVSYFLNKYFTFKSKKKSSKEVIRFVINIAVCYSIAYGVAKPLTLWLLPMLFKGLTEYANYISMIAGAGIFFVLNYLSQRFFVFKTDKPNNIEKSDSNDKD